MTDCGQEQRKMIIMNSEFGSRRRAQSIASENCPEGDICVRSFWGSALSLDGPISSYHTSLITLPNGGADERFAGSANPNLAYRPLRFLRSQPAQERRRGGSDACGRQEFRLKIRDNWLGILPHKKTLKETYAD